MNTKSKKVLLILVMACFLITMSLGAFSCLHPDPVFNIGNNFSETVTVYFNGHNMGKIKAGSSKKFFPNDILTKTDQYLQVDFKGNSGATLFSKVYSWDELMKLLESIHGNPYWIGPETK